MSADRVPLTITRDDLEAQTRSGRISGELWCVNVLFDAGHIDAAIDLQRAIIKEMRRYDERARAGL